MQTGLRQGTEPVPRGGWLTAEELESWLALVRLIVRLPFAIESELQRESGLKMIEYQALAMLSEQDDHTLRMSDLAELTNASLSRLSHLVARLERRGFIVRAPDPHDGRVTRAMLTAAGLDVLVAAAPRHVETVRRLVLDTLTPTRLRRLGEDAQRIVERIDAAGD